jgi:hypothetical protein
MASTEHGKLERDRALSLLELLDPLVSEWDLRVRLELADPQGQQVIQASLVIPVRQARLALPDLLALRVQRVLLALLEQVLRDQRARPEMSQAQSAPPVSVPQETRDQLVPPVRQVSQARQLTLAQLERQAAERVRLGRQVPRDWLE